MTKIIRNKIVQEEVDIPEGHVICPTCEGRGMTSLYDEGFKSLFHDARLDAKRTCSTCDGNGYVSE